MKRPLLAARGLLALAAAVGLVACSKPPVTQQAEAFGLKVSVSIQGMDDSKARQMAGAVLADIAEFNKRWQVAPPSEVATLNEAFATTSVPQPASVELVVMLRDARRYESWADGLFNPALGNLKTSTPLAAAELTRLVGAKPSLQGLAIGDKAIASHNSAIRLDLSDVAPGWLLDREVATLRAQGAENALLQIGSQAIALGRNGRSDWALALPMQPQAKLVLKDGEALGMAQAGQIDPRTGAPATSMRFVAVVTSAGPQAAMVAQILAQPLLIGGSTTARDYAKRFQVADVLMVDAAGKVFASDTMQKRLNWDADKPEIQPLP